MHYKVKYRDNRGKEESYLERDSRDYLVTLRGVRFESLDFEIFFLNVKQARQKNASDKFDLMTWPSKETFSKDLYLFHCKIEIEIPVIIQSPEKEIFTKMYLHLNYREPHAGNETKLSLQIGYECKEKKFSRIASSYDNHCFKEVLSKLQSHLPQDHSIKSCFTCLYSTYHPLGNNCFGDMLCFKVDKKVFIENNFKSTKNFYDMIDAIKRSDKDFRYNYVEETFLCGEYKFKDPVIGW